MMEIKIDNNKKETIKQKSQCHSSSNKTNFYIPTLATILEGSAMIETVASSQMKIMKRITMIISR
jgi:hypothetical protein